jgi:FkbM family methyltransferase
MLVPGMTTSRGRLVAAVLHRYPFLSGVGRVANSKVTRTLAGEMHGTGWARTASGALALTPLDDHAGRSAYFIGDIDPTITRLCRLLLRRGDVALDIGANVGIVTLLMSHRVGNEGRVYAFEPNPTAGDLLATSLKRNAITNVELHRVALGATEDTLPLVVPPGNIGGASLLHPTDTGEAVEVPVRTLAGVFEGREPRSIRLVKVDVEGYERDVLSGARPLFERVPPDAIITECWGLESEAGRALAQDLERLGYEVFVIARTLVRLRLVPFGKSAKGVAAAHDVIAVRPEASTSAIASSIVGG